MTIARVSTQNELDVALATPAPHEIWICGTGDFVLRDSAQHFVRATDTSHVVARESSHVEARGSSHVVARGSSHVVAWGSSHVVARESSHVEAWESSHVVAWESSHVEARESSHVEAWESSHVVAWGAVLVRARDRANVKAASTLIVIMNHATTTSIEGGTVVQVPPVTTAEAWCDYYGVEVQDGIAMVYKAVNDAYRSGYDFPYTPGSIPVASDWDGGRAECGGGLHFSPTPIAAKDFNNGATRFLACPVRLTDIRAPKANDSHPSKIKASGCCGPVVEVDLWRQPMVRAGGAA
jgi:hypothetical protein